MCVTLDGSEANWFAETVEDIREAALQWGDYVWQWSMLCLKQKEDVEILRVLGRISYVPTSLRCRLYAMLCNRYTVSPMHCMSAHALTTFAQRAAIAEAVMKTHGAAAVAEHCAIP